MSLRPRPRSPMGDVRAWLASPSARVGLGVVVLSTVLLALKDRSQVAQVSAAGLWSQWTAHYGDQSVVVAVALTLGALTAATSQSSGLNALRHLRGASALAVAVRALAVAGAIAGVLFAVRIVVEAVAAEVTTHVAHLPLPLSSPLGFVDGRLIVGDLAAAVVLAMVGASIGLAAGRASTALAIAVPLGLASLDQFALFYEAFSRVGSVASYLPGGLAVTLVEGRAGVSARGIAVDPPLRSAWIGAVGLGAIITVLVAIAARRGQVLEPSARPAGELRWVVPSLAAVAVGLFLPALFATGVPWRFRTAWLAERHEHTSSVDVVQRFAVELASRRPAAARAQLLVPAGGADPATAGFYAPWRHARSVRVGPDSAMASPDLVPVAVRVGAVVVHYELDMVRRNGRWWIGGVQVSTVDHVR